MEACVRTYRVSDFDALCDLVDAATAPARATTRHGLEDFLAFPGFRSETDLFVATAAATNSPLLAARDVRVIARGDEAVPILESWGVARPEVSDDVRDALIHVSLARASKILRERDRTQGIYQVRSRADDTTARDRFAGFGIHEARSLFTMERSNLAGIGAPQFPAGITTHINGQAMMPHGCRRSMRHSATIGAALWAWPRRIGRCARNNRHSIRE